ncbi:hypothetical protein [Paraburkholderia sp. LEh10]|uniref:hypothetical protein n=1 Tax=Paraburkholderia sp. LEh10 TaxID=2821353 RepID=UPI001FD7F7C3|nr:hypothetical protein [Paraburkholderia sp. LEh10]
MNITIAGRIGAPTAGESLGILARRFVERLRVPPEAWSVRRRWIAALSIAVATFAFGANAWLAADMSGVQAGSEALSAVQRKLSEAERAVAQLPALRRAAPVEHVPASWSSADDVRVISQLAANHDVALLGIEPGSMTGAGLDAMRVLHVTAQADFDHVGDFFEALASLPVLVVPEEVTLKRQGASLAISATLRSFSAIHPVRNAALPSARNDPDAFDPDEEIMFYDPFLPATLAPAFDRTSTSMRLVGLLADHMRGLALIETGEGAAMLEPGQRWGDEQVAHIDATGLTLASRDAACIR